MTFPVGRTEVRVTFGALALAAFCIVAGEGKALLLSALSLAVHECAHLIAAKNRGVSVARVTLYPFGAVMTADDAFGRQGEWITAAAGPVGSAAFAAVLSLFGTLFPLREWMRTLIYTNLLIAGINLLPAFPLDGGRVFSALLLRFGKPRMARRVLLGFTAAIGLGAIGAGIFLILHGLPAWTLLALPPFLLASAFSELSGPDAGTVARVMERSEALLCGVPQRAEIVVLPEGTRVGAAMAALSRRRLTILRIRQRDGYFELDEAQLIRAAARTGMETPLNSEIFRLTARK